MDLFSFIKQTEGLENSLDFAIKYGLLPDKSPRDCIKCGRKKGLRWTRHSRVVNLPYMFVCAQKECRSTVSLGRNTIFDHLGFSLSQSLRLMYFWLLRISVKETADQLQVQEVAVVEWFNFFREVCAFIIINYTQAIGGVGHIVDICEYKLQTKSEANYDLWIFTGIDRTIGQNYAIHVENLDCDTLWPVMKNFILPGTTVVTPNFREYAKMEGKTKEHSLNFAPPSKYPLKEGDFNLHGMWETLKQFIDSEVALDPTNTCKELYVYQFLYFNRDGLCNKTVSELVIPFINDIKQVYPGFEKEKRIEYMTQRLPARK